MLSSIRASCRFVCITEDRKLDGFFETMTADDTFYLGYFGVAQGSSPSIFVQGTQGDRGSLDQGLRAEPQSEDH